MRRLGHNALRVKDGKITSFDPHPEVPRRPGLRCNHCDTAYPGLKGPCPNCGKNTAQKLITIYD